MNVYALVRVLIDLLRAKPSVWPAVETFWFWLRGHDGTAADTERFDDQMTVAVEVAKITVASR